MTLFSKIMINVSISGFLAISLYEAGFFDELSLGYEMAKRAERQMLKAVQFFKKDAPRPIKELELPSKDELCRNAVNYWNSGVIASIAFTQNLPNRVCNGVTNGISYIFKELSGEQK